MGFRFRIGPFTFGRSGTRLSLWGPNGGVSIPLTGKKGSTFGKIGFGPVSWYFNKSKNSQQNEINPGSYNVNEKKIHILNSYQSAAIAAIESDKKFLNKLQQYGLPWRGVQERIKEELPDNLANRDKISYSLVPETMDAIFGEQNIAWMTEKRPSKSGTGLTTWIVIL